MKETTLKIIVAVLSFLLAVNLIFSLILLSKNGEDPSEEFKGYRFRIKTEMGESDSFYISSVVELSDEWIRITYHNGRPWDDGMSSMDVKKKDVFIITPKDPFGLESWQIESVRYDEFEKDN